MSLLDELNDEAGRLEELVGLAGDPAWDTFDKTLADEEVAFIDALLASGSDEDRVRVRVLRDIREYPSQWAKRLIEVREEIAAIEEQEA